MSVESRPLIMPRAFSVRESRTHQLFFASTFMLCTFVKQLLHLHYKLSVLPFTAHCQVTLIVMHGPCTEDSPFMKTDTCTGNHADHSHQAGGAPGAGAVASVPAVGPSDGGPGRGHLWLPPEIPPAHPQLCPAPRCSR